MKTFDLETFKVDGNTFVNLSWSFDKVNGLKIDKLETKVSIRPQVVPANGCDFVSQLGSCSSSNFYENNSNLDINDLFFVPKFNYKLKGFIYCLPENVNLVLANIEQQVNTFLVREITLMRNDLNTLEKLIK